MKMIRVVHFRIDVSATSNDLNYTNHHTFTISLFKALVSKIVWRAQGELRKTSCANEFFYFQNKRLAQLGFPTKPSCANLKIYLCMNMRA